jgi:hypothetical protein
VEAIEVGSGLDIGYVRGFHGPEVDADGMSYRWTTERAEFRELRSPVVFRDVDLHVTWSGWRPESLPQALVHTEADEGNGGRMIALPLSPEWERRRLPFIEPDTTRPKASSTSSTSTFELGSTFRVTSFVPGGSDQRLLGVRVASIEMIKIR